VRARRQASASPARLVPAPGCRDAYLAYLAEHAGWLNARAAVLSP
jgi:hypothetical protein